MLICSSFILFSLYLLLCYSHTDDYYVNSTCGPTHKTNFDLSSLEHLHIIPCMRTLCLCCSYSFKVREQINFFDAKLDCFSTSSVSEAKKSMCGVICGFS